MKSVLRTRAALGIAAAALGLVAACSKTEPAQPAAPVAPVESTAQSNLQTPPAPEGPGVGAPQKTEAASGASAAPDPGPGRGCLRVVADHPYSFKDRRFDETAQALAHASGCFIRYTDRELAALRIAPVEGRMSIRDAVAKALEGLPYEVASATDAEVVVAKKPQP